MENNAFYISFENNDDREFFLEEIMTRPLLEEIERRVDSSRKIKYCDIDDKEFLRGLTYELFWGKDIDKEVLETIFDSLVKNNNVKLFVNYDTFGFSYIYDEKDSLTTLLICGSFIDYY